MLERVEEAIIEGNLLVRMTARDDTLDRLAGVDESLADELRATAAPYLMYGKRFFVSPRAATEWATRPPGRFPQFPFCLDDLESAIGNAAAGKPPAFTCWEDVTIRFTSEHMVQITIGDRRLAPLTYQDLGLDDRRTGNPKKAWGALHELARLGGTIKSARSDYEWAPKWSAVEKRIGELRERLRSHFSTDTDPIPFVPGLGYQAAFRLDKGSFLDE